MFLIFAKIYLLHFLFSIVFSMLKSEPNILIMKYIHSLNFPLVLSFLLFCQILCLYIYFQLTNLLLFLKYVFFHSSPLFLVLVKLGAVLYVLLLSSTLLILLIAAIMTIITNMFTCFHTNFVL